MLRTLAVVAIAGVVLALIGMGGKDRATRHDACPARDDRLAAVSVLVLWVAPHLTHRFGRLRPTDVRA